MTLSNTQQEKAGVPHILLGVVAFLALALCAPVLRVLMLLFGA